MEVRPVNVVGRALNAMLVDRLFMNVIDIDSIEVMNVARGSASCKTLVICFGTCPYLLM